MNELSSDQLNEILTDLADNEGYDVRGLEGTGKCIPYVGWYWRQVDFDADAGYLGDCGQFVGFMQKDKWGYGYIIVKGEKWARVKQLLRAAVADPSDTTLQAVFDYMQGLANA